MQRLKRWHALLVLLLCGIGAVQAWGQGAAPAKPGCYPPAHAHIDAGYWTAPGAIAPSGSGVAWTCATKFGFSFHNANWLFKEYEPAAATIKTKAARDAEWSSHAWRVATDGEKEWARGAFTRLHAKADKALPVFKVAANGTSATRPVYAFNNCGLDKTGCIRSSASVANLRASVGAVCDCGTRSDIPSSATRAYCLVPGLASPAMALCGK